jgi:hypothetical protein
VALVHDYLNQRGGAERVALELAHMFPQAPLYTSLYRPDSTFPEFRSVDIRTSFLDRLPIDDAFRCLFPLYPRAFASLEIEADVIISSSSGWGHRIRRPKSGFHAVYCHTPARWLYAAEYLTYGARQQVLRGMLAPLRRGDRRAALRADLYIANGLVTRDRIRSAYGIEAPIVSPPRGSRRASGASGSSSSRGCCRTSAWTSRSTRRPAPASGSTWWATVRSSLISAVAPGRRWSSTDASRIPR